MSRRVFVVGIVCVMTIMLFFVWQRINSFVTPSTLVVTVSGAGNTALDETMIETGGISGTAEFMTDSLTPLSPGAPQPTHLLKAQQDGAMAKITFRVVDETGQPVAGATVAGGFYNHGRDGHGFSQQTDTGGVVTLEGLCVYEVNYHVNKEGYYTTRTRYDFYKRGFDCVKDGRWIPWDPEVDVILKRKVNPVAMAVHRGTNRLPLPKLKEWTGFDLEYADWTAPHGKGKSEDFQVLLRVIATNRLGAFSTYTLTLRFPRPFDGVCLMKKESGGSSFRTIYEADTNRIYDSAITFTHERKTVLDQNKVVVNDHLLNADEYLVLRVRSELDQNGRLLKANYAKLYAPLFAAKYGFLISSYFNPEINNPSLEADTTKNLLNPHDLGFPP